MADTSATPPQNLPTAGDPKTPPPGPGATGQPMDVGKADEPAKPQPQFADEVLMPKEAPRKSPVAEKKEAGEMGAVPPPAEQQPQPQPTGEPPQAAGEPPKDVPPPEESQGPPTPPLQEAAPAAGGEDLMKSLSDKQVTASERKTILYKIITVVIVILFIGGLAIGGVFAYNRWVKPIFEEEVVEEPPVSEEPGVKPEVVPPKEVDSDGDSLPNDWETQHGLNPNDSADAFDDPDFDQLKNNEEHQYGTDPRNPDTDADGFRDGTEVQGGFNPNGEGKLSDAVNGDDTQSLEGVAGEYTGTINGSRYSAQDLDFTLEDDGTIIGTYNFTNGGEEIFNRAKGTYTYDKNSGQFSAELKVKGFLGQEGVDYTLYMTGQSQAGGQINGTWNSVIDREVPWLSNDRGTFSLK